MNNYDCDCMQLHKNVCIYYMSSIIISIIPDQIYEWFQSAFMYGEHVLVKNDKC